MICGSHYQEHVSDESDRKEDAMENHSKYHSSDIPDQDNQNDDEEAAQMIEKNKSGIFKIEKHKSVDSGKDKMELDSKQ